MVRFLRITIFMIVLLFLGGFFVVSREINLQNELIRFIENLETAYPLIVIIIFVLTLFSTLTGLPVLYLGIAMGFFVPFLPAFVASWAINLLSVIATYFMIRYFFSNYFREKFGHRKMIIKINKRIKKYGFWTVALTRSIYIIPTNIINFSFPLSKISLRQYMNGTMIGLIPECLINVTTGYLLKNQLILLSSPQKDLVSIAISSGAMAIILLVLSILYIRKRKVRKARINDIIAPLDDE